MTLSDLAIQIASAITVVASACSALGLRSMHVEAKMAQLFPIVRSGLLGQLEEVCGTGFLVSPVGHFLTCFHIFEAWPNATYSVASDPSNLRKLVPIKLLKSIPENDVMLAQVSAERCDIPLVLAQGLPAKAGAVVTAVGYAGGTFREPDGSLNYSSTDLIKIDGAYIGWSNKYRIGAHAKDGMHFSAKEFSAILSTPALVGGFSGCPIFNHDGEVIGLHSNNSAEHDLTAKFNNGQPIAISACADALGWLLYQELPERRVGIRNYQSRP